MNWINRKRCKNVRYIITKIGEGETVEVVKRDVTKPATFVTVKFKPVKGVYKDFYL